MELPSIKVQWAMLLNVFKDYKQDLHENEKSFNLARERELWQSQTILIQGKLVLLRFIPYFQKEEEYCAIQK